jgi:hypothetical protein
MPPRIFVFQIRLKKRDEYHHSRYDPQVYGLPTSQKLECLSLIESGGGLGSLSDDDSEPGK